MDMSEKTDNYKRTEKSKCKEMKNTVWNKKN